jgi:hypothetical protein
MAVSGTALQTAPIGVSMEAKHKIHSGALFRRFCDVKSSVFFLKSKGWVSPGYHRIAAIQMVPIHKLLDFNKVSNGVLIPQTINISYTLRSENKGNS